MPSTSTAPEQVRSIRAQSQSSGFTEPAAVKPVPLHPGLSAEAPTVAPAHDPPLGDVDQSSAFDPSDPAPVPDESRDGLVRAKQDARAEDEFDQTVSW